MPMHMYYIVLPQKMAHTSDKAVNYNHPLEVLNNLDKHHPVHTHAKRKKSKRK